MFGSVSHLFWT